MLLELEPELSNASDVTLVVEIRRVSAAGGAALRRRDEQEEADDGSPAATFGGKRRDDPDENEACAALCGRDILSESRGSVDPGSVQPRVVPGSTENLSSLEPKAEELLSGLERRRGGTADSTGVGKEESRLGGTT